MRKIIFSIFSLVVCLALVAGTLVQSAEASISIVDKLVARTTAGTDDQVAGAGFGYDVAIWGDTAVVSAKKKEVDGESAAGLVYVFKRNSDGKWNVSQTLKAQKTDGSTDVTADANFGETLALSDDTLVVGCSDKVEDGKDSAGAAYVFTKNQVSGDWEIARKLTIADAGEVAVESDSFGGSVAVSGDVVAVGAYGVEISGVDSAGAVYLFSKTDWSLIKKVTALADDGTPENSGSNGFTGTVRLDGGHLVVAARSWDNGAVNDVGAVYVYSKDAGVDGWGIVKKITALKSDGSSDQGAGNDFGCNVDISGDIIAVGAEDVDTPSRYNCGAAYIYRKDVGGDNNWGIVKKIIPRTADETDDSQVRGYFGRAVAVSGDYVLIGTKYRMLNGYYEAGAAYLYYKDDGGIGNWGSVGRVEPQLPSGESDAEYDARVADVVAISGGSLIIGGYQKNKSDAETDTGAAYIYSATPLATGGDNDGEKIVVAIPDQPSGTSVSVSANAKHVKSKDELERQYRPTGLNEMLGSQTYDFTAMVNANDLAYFAFNCTSLGERRAGEVALFKLFTDKDSLTFTYSADKHPTEEGYFWITDETNSGQYIDPNMILEGGRTYTVNYSVKDNGAFDIDDTPGKIVDPVVPGVSSGGGGGGGCVLNPGAESSVELIALLLVALAGMCLRLRKMQ